MDQSPVPVALPAPASSPPRVRDLVARAAELERRADYGDFRDRNREQAGHWAALRAEAAALRQAAAMLALDGGG